nr:MAG TPA: hypothetical protein [Bacteriophage sp.]
MKNGLNTSFSAISNQFIPFHLFVKLMFTE